MENIDARDAYRTIVGIFQQKIEKGLPLTEQEKTLIKNAKSWSTKSEAMEQILKCFFDSDLA
jgi:hypothetical protein